MNPKAIILNICLASLFLFSFKFQKNEPLNDSFPAKLNFYKGSYDDFLRDAKKQKKLILIDFWASWCGPCQKMENETFQDENFTQYINENYMIFKVDIDNFDGMEIASRFSVDTYPTMVVLDEKGKYIKRLRGFFPANYLINELSKNSISKTKRIVFSN